MDILLLLRVVGKNLVVITSLSLLFLVNSNRRIELHVNKTGPDRRRRRRRLHRDASVEKRSPLISFLRPTCAAAVITDDSGIAPSVLIV